MGWKSLAVVTVLSACVAGQARAQVAYFDGQRPLATRADLEQALATMPPKDRDGAIGRIVRQRLAYGDFVPGDRIQLSVVSDTSLSGTFTVRSDTTITAPNIEPISLRGVLRSELEEHLTKEVARYLRNPTVTARSLVRIAVQGAVSRPGFYDLAPDSPASDIIVSAGGLADAGDIQKTVVQRGPDRLYDKDQVRDFFVASASIDQMGLHTGDQFSVGRRGAANILPIVGAITGIAFAVAAFAGLF